MDPASSCVMGCEQEGWAVQLFSLAASQALSVLREKAACGGAAPALAQHAKSSPARQDHHRPLPHSFSTAYNYRMYTNHSLFSTVLDLARQLWQATIGTMSAPAQKNFLVQQSFLFYLSGGWDPDKRSSVWSERGPSWFPLLLRLANVQWSAWVNSASRGKKNRFLGRMCLNCPKMSHWIFCLINTM